VETGRLLLLLLQFWTEAWEVREEQWTRQGDQEDAVVDVVP